MKKLLLIFAFLTAGILFISCDDEDPITPPVETDGKVYVTSTPAGAQIFVGQNNSGKVTPDSVQLAAGTYNITLRIAEYFDTTFSVTITVGETTEKNITLVSSLAEFGPIRIWETLAPASKPSGLDLSSGQKIAVSGTDKMLADIYYSTDGFLVQSAHLFTSQGLTRVTKFKVGSSNNINDGVDAPAVDNTWITGVTDMEVNYFFLYDDDDNYSKARINGRGTDSDGDAWVELTYWYNKESDDIGF